MRQSRSAKFTLPPLDLTKAGQANSTLEKQNKTSDSIQPGVRSVEIGYFPHLIRSTGTRPPSSSRLGSHNEARAFPASASAATDQKFIQKETIYASDYNKALPSPEKRQKHTCGHEQLEILRRRLEPYKEAIQNDNSLAIAHAKTPPLEATHSKFLIRPSPSSKTEEEIANMEPFSTAPIFSFLVEETWDGSSQTLLVYQGQRIPVDLTLAENNELKEGYLYQFVGRQEIGDVQEELF